MASGCLIVGSDTAPVREVILDKKNGLLVNFFKLDEIAEWVLLGLAKPELFKKLRKAASITAQRYSIEHGNNHYVRAIMASVGKRQAGPPINRFDNGTGLPSYANRRVNS